MEYRDRTFDEERALYGLHGAAVRNCRFDGPADGESALKESSDIEVSGCYLNLRYPLWHVGGARISGCEFTENCRAALWYCRDIEISSCRLGGIKALRECRDITLRDSSVNSTEFIWKCRNLTVSDVSVEQSEYPFFEVAGARISGLRLKGKYSFQYDSDIEISNSRLDTKDAFWHARNVTVRDSIINGEYLGWYSEKLTLINCAISGTQPFCYCKDLVLENCTMTGCDLAFERSSVRADIRGTIDSVKNVLCGKIVADSFGAILMEDSIVDPSATQIVCRAAAAPAAEQG